MGLLSRGSARGLLASRGSALAGVGVLHVAVVAGLLHMKYAERPEPAIAAIKVTNFQVQQRQDEPVPDIPVQLEPPPMQVVIPVVQITLPTPPPTAITPPPPPPPRAAPPEVAAVEAPPAPMMLDISEVEFVKQPDMAYPRSAKLARIEGTVLVWALIDPDGHPREVRVHRTSGSEQLDRAGCDGVRSWQFRPHKPHGVAVPVQVIVPVIFELNERMARHGGGRRPPPGGPPDGLPHGDRDYR